MKDLLLVGAGGHCHACIDVIEQTNQFNIIGVIDKNLKQESILGYPIVGTDDDLARYREICTHAIITIGQIKHSQIRPRLFKQLLELQFELPAIISPLAYVAKGVSIGRGTIVMHGSIINRCSKIGENNIINSRALIEHDAIIGNHTHIATGAIVNGGAVVGNHVFIGSQSVIIQKQSVPDYHFIKANQLFFTRESLID